jgi:hypothetical protein
MSISYAHTYVRAIISMHSYLYKFSLPWSSVRLSWKLFSNFCFAYQRLSVLCSADRKKKLSVFPSYSNTDKTCKNMGLDVANTILASWSGGPESRIEAQMSDIVTEGLQVASGLVHCIQVLSELLYYNWPDLCVSDPSQFATQNLPLTPHSSLYKQFSWQNFNIWTHKYNLAVYFELATKREREKKRLFAVGERRGVMSPDLRAPLVWFKYRKPPSGELSV